MEVFVLFQTDVWKSEKSRVCFGVFSSEERAISAAKKESLFSSDSEVVILYTTLDEFEEI